MAISRNGSVAAAPSLVSIVKILAAARIITPDANLSATPPVRKSLAKMQAVNAANVELS